MGSTYERTFEIINDLGSTDLYNFLSNIIHPKIEKTHLMKNILFILSDQYVNNIDKDTRHKLVLALRTNFDLVWSTINTGNTNLDKIINWMYEDVYYVKAFNGIRVATQNEVDEGVASLLTERKWALGEQGEELYKQFNLMMWTITGKLTYYRLGGYRYNWGKNGLEDDYIQLLTRAGSGINRLYETLRSDGQYDRIITAMNKVIRKGRFKYPNFAVDEIQSDISVKQLIYIVDKEIWDNREGFKEVKGILMRIKKDNQYKPTPLDISKIREVHSIMNSPDYKKSLGSDIKLTRKQQEIKKVCDRIQEDIKDKYMKENDWGPKIASTLIKNNYKFCSDKQLKIMQDEISRVDKIKEKENEASEIKEISMEDDMEDVYNIMDALGRGDLSLD